MSEGMGSEVAVTMVVRTERHFRAEYESEPMSQSEERAEETLLGDLAQDFDAVLTRAVSVTRSSLDEIEADLMSAMQDTASGAPGRPGLLASFAQLFQGNPAMKAQQKLDHVREVRQITDILAGIAEAFPKEYDAYRRAVVSLNGVLDASPSYLEFTRNVEKVAETRGIKPQYVKALMNDACCQSADIKELRTALQAVLSDPAISPVFREVENRYQVVDRMMTDVAAGTNRLGREKRLDMTAFRPLADLAEQMSQNIDKPAVSRPGGIQMDGQENSMTQQLKKLSASIREMIERVLHSVRAAFQPGGPSPAP